MLIQCDSVSAHRMRVTAVMFAASHDWVLSCGRDKYFQWHCSETGRRLGGYQTSGWCTSLQYPCFPAQLVCVCTCMCMHSSP